MRPLTGPHESARSARGLKQYPTGALLAQPQDLAQKLRETGFALLEGYQSERSADEVVNLLGEADTLGVQGPIHYLKPAPADARSLNTYSGNYGLGIFPLHTDMAHWHIPPRFLMLRCLQGSTAVPTVPADSLPIIEQVSEIVVGSVQASEGQPRGGWCGRTDFRLRHSRSMKILSR
jgi:L-asparagine oxygenase